MLRFILQLACIIVITFVLLSWSPIDPVTALLGDNLFAVSAAQKALIADQLGIHIPLIQNFMIWGQHVLSGDWGESVYFQQPVIDVIAEKAPKTVLLTSVSLLLSLIVGYGLGLVAALQQGRWIDRLLYRTAWALTCIPGFWLGFILIAFFAVKLQWLPVGGSQSLTLQNTNALDTLQHLVLPVTTLVLTYSASLLLHTREKVIDVLASDYIRYARIHQIKLSRILWSHVIRNSIVPVIILQCTHIAELFSGSILTEVIFNYPGLGSALINAGLRGDSALIMAITIMLGTLVFAGNALATLLQYKLMPYHVK